MRRIFGAHGLAALLLSVGCAAPSVAAAQVAVSGQDRSLALACNGAPATIRGDDNHVSLAGQCRFLRIEGSRNAVNVELGSPGTVQITGDYNQVVYAPGGRPPVTTLHGYYNEVVPGPTGAVPGSLVLDGTLGQRDVPCRGLDIVIRESEARYVLRGGCRSVTIEGRRDTVAAELLPSARLVISGTGVVVNYALVADGPPPVVVVTAPGARATHLVRYGESALVLPTATTLPR